MRVFFALTITQACKYKLHDACRKTTKDCKRGKFTSCDNLHLTLAFIGDVTDDEVERLSVLLDEFDVCKPDLVAASFGQFHKKNKKILWIGVEENQTLLRLQGELNFRLKQAGFRVEAMPYVPHITFARGVVLDEDVSMRHFSPIEVTISSVALMESVRVDERLVYRVVKEKGFTDK
ncbi:MULTISPECIES: RNA 2',3'-cyclic phosphodiesterase [unclassified Fusibacter]|uniref:RNA 2',3'-cyclic phosphodiesterase n=1 Tax=unclassified Fusibacter TaxID=2624464 RepID=UPI0013E91D0A|nr:RNA 2',3'-cyclic phosphodiesterase [Fusibacter sp. A1]MCK8058037.1 RNA 2',3'-cyclic phosphodiesterase [Fusibacter sp. A2]NPE20619.1 RNA 2',3'-cyclic phosphodiesterase [Fusibacter sp. A1]